MYWIQLNVRKLSLILHLKRLRKECFYIALECVMINEFLTNYFGMMMKEINNLFLTIRAPKEFLPRTPRWVSAALILSYLSIHNPLSH